MPQGYAFVGDLARGMLPMGKINREWHEKNRMPRNPTPEQRIKWHTVHPKHCGCRPIPKGVIALMKARTVDRSTRPRRKANNGRTAVTKNARE